MSTSLDRLDNSDDAARADPPECGSVIKRITQYGVRTPNTTAILVLTTDLAVAERSLHWIQGGHIVERTVSYGEWQAQH